MIPSNTELFFINLGFNVMGSRVVHKTADREDAVNELNDPNSNVQMLVTSYQRARDCDAVTHNAG